MAKQNKTKQNKTYMAIKTTTDTQDSIITGQVPPRMKDRYTLRVKSATSGESKSEKKNFMITLECEIIDPLIKEFDGSKYALDSLEHRYYLMLKVNDDDGIYSAEKSAKALAALIGRKPGDNCLHKRLGLPQEIDDENPDCKQYLGLTFDALLNSMEKKPQKPDPQNPGKFIAVTDASGKPIVQGWEMKGSIEDILGLSEFKGNRAF